MSDGGFSLVIQAKSVRQKSYQEVKRLERVENIVVSERDVMCGAPVYPWTRTFQSGLLATAVANFGPTRIRLVDALFRSIIPSLPGM
jgi:hypothetical protein